MMEWQECIKNGRRMELMLNLAQKILATKVEDQLHAVLLRKKCSDEWLSETSAVTAQLPDVRLRNLAIILATAGVYIC